MLAHCDFEGPNHGLRALHDGRELWARPACRCRGRGSRCSNAKTWSIGHRAPKHRTAGRRFRGCCDVKFEVAMYNHGGRDVGGANALGASVEVASCKRRGRLVRASNGRRASLRVALKHLPSRPRHRHAGRARNSRLACNARSPCVGPSRSQCASIEVAVCEHRTSPHNV